MIVVGLLLTPLFTWYFALNNVAVYRSISVVTLIELAQGAARADTAQRKENGTRSSMNCLRPCPFIRSR
jgi:hypothetical protein